MVHTGKIKLWHNDKGFGWLDADGRKIFLHWRDFTEKHKRPEVGDVIRFEIGEDTKKRPCAVRATHVNDGGRIRPTNIIVLVLLLFFPICALLDCGLSLHSALIAVALLSTYTYYAYADDKRRARLHGWRLSEQYLHILELIGGWPGAYIAQRRLRHKVSKPMYQLIFWAIVILHQLVAYDCLLDWRWTKQMLAAGTEIPARMGGMNDSQPGGPKYQPIHDVN